MFSFQPRHHFTFCIIASALVASSTARTIPFDYKFIEKSLRTTTKNQVDFKQIGKSPVVYQAWGVWNIKQPVSEVAEVAIDFLHYPLFFRHVFRSDPIHKPQYYKGPGSTWYVEGRAARARVWAIGVIDSLYWKDSSQLRLIAHQNEDPYLEQKWRYRLKGWLNFRTHGVQLAAFIVPTGPTSCRIGIVSQGWVKKAMPTWLVKLAAQMILPQLMQDLENEVIKRANAKKPKPKPWYHGFMKR